jgi:hypothetical protein
MASLIKREERLVFSKIQKHILKLTSISDAIKTAMKLEGKERQHIFLNIDVKSNDDYIKVIHYYQHTLEIRYSFDDIIKERIYKNAGDPLTKLRKYIPLFL